MLWICQQLVNVLLPITVCALNTKINWLRPSYFLKLKIQGFISSTLIVPKQNRQLFELFMATELDKIAQLLFKVCCKIPAQMLKKDNFHMPYAYAWTFVHCKNWALVYLSGAWENVLTLWQYLRIWLLQIANKTSLT